MEDKNKNVSDSLNEDVPSLLLKIKDNDEFVFETDSYALQNNKDYQRLLETLIKLQTQRAFTVKALEELHQTREVALKDPFAFVQALQNGEVTFQPRIKIAQVPEIDISKYDISPYIEAMRPNTRRSTKESSIAAHLSDKKSSDSCDSNGKPSKPKSATHNVCWTAEEQRRLEELLIKHPDEPIAAKRYAKIAKELGTRTLMQVQSRVQKYFIALKREGLPVPGRDPKSAGLRNPPRRRNYLSHTCSSTKFMKAFDFEDPLERRRSKEEADPPFETEPRGAEALLDSGIHSFSTDNYNEETKIKIEAKDDLNLKKLLSLEKLQKIKTQEVHASEKVHIGIKCDGCNQEPIRGIRWHCYQCPQNPGLDLCHKCVKHFTTDRHIKKHNVKPIYTSNAKETFRKLIN